MHIDAVSSPTLYHVIIVITVAKRSRSDRSRKQPQPICF